MTTKYYTCRVKEPGDGSGQFVRACATGLFDLVEQVKTEFGGEKAQIELHLITIESCTHEKGKQHG